MEASSLRRLAPAVLILAPVLLVAFAVPLLPLADPVRQEIAGRLAGPSAAHWLGQDEYGRDVLSRLLWGARVSLSIALAASVAAAVVGTLLGLLGGYFRGLVEFATVRVAEVVLCFPPLLLALLVVTLLGPGSLTLIVSLAILFAPNFARVAYAETLSARALDYVTAQVSLGAGAPRILALTVLPNVAAPLIVQVSLTVAAALLLESGLSFLGLGVVPPAPSWGLMIRGARTTMQQAPLLLVWPCLALTLTVLLLNRFCDRLRDILDPRARAPGPPAFLRRTPVLAEPAPVRGAAGGLLAVRGLTLEAPGPRGPVAVVRGLDLALAHGETLAVVGESGSGKTLTGLAVMGLLPPGIRVASGEIAFAGASGPAADLLRLPERRLRALRGGALSMIFQDPASSLNPLLRVGTQVGEALRAHRGRGVRARGVRARVVSLLDRVGLPDPARRARSYAHELSGGQRQRVMIASAVANHPRLLIADEPTTALDVTVQAQILALTADLKRAEPDMGLIFITHNLPVVAAIADRVAVMYAGEVFEEGAVTEVFERPLHPYTAALIASTPEGAEGRLLAIPGAVPPPWADLPGCRFAPRCAHAAAACRETAPRLEPAGSGRSTRCLRWTEIA